MTHIDFGPYTHLLNEAKDDASSEWLKYHTERKKLEKFMSSYTTAVESMIGTLSNNFRKVGVTNGMKGIKVQVGDITHREEGLTYANYTLRAGVKEMGTARITVIIRSGYFDEWEKDGRRIKIDDVGSYDVAVEILQEMGWLL